MNSGPGATIGKVVLEIIIPLMPPSVNSAYTVRPQFRRNGRLGMGIGMKADVRRFVSDAQYFMPNVQLRDDALYSLNIELSTNWLTKAGELRKKDVGNYEKFIVDALFARYHLDDKLLWTRCVTKRQSAKDQVKLTLTSLGTIDEIIEKEIP